MFDWDKTKYPRTWREMSFDFKAMFVYFGAMMAMMMAGAAMAASAKVAVAGAIATGATMLSLQHRRAAGWRWRRPGPRGIVRALFSLAIAAVLILAVSPTFPTADAAPWYLALLGIVTMNVLGALRITYLAEADFLADCGDAAPDARHSVASSIPSWKNALRIAFSVFFLAVWLDGMGSFYLAGITMRDGLPSPTETASAPYTEHGRTVYVTATRKAEIDAMQTVMMAGIPLAIISAFFLQLVVGVRIFPNMPVRGEPRS